MKLSLKQVIILKHTYDMRTWWQQKIEFILPVIQRNR